MAEPNQVPHALLASIVEAQRLTANALEEVEYRIARIESFLARIPPSFMPVFNDFMETEGDARMAHGLLNILRDGDAFSKPFPQDVKDRRVTRRLARTNPNPSLSVAKEVADWHQPSSEAKTDMD